MFTTQCIPVALPELCDLPTSFITDHRTIGAEPDSQGIDHAIAAESVATFHVSFEGEL